jgi:ribosomal protein S18 acetylase RimI-like enzyme
VVLIRAARPDERAALEALQWRSSLHNPGDREALEAHPDAIELPIWQIEAGHVRVLEASDEVAGFSVLLAPADGACELDGLFVEPGRMRAGLGRALVEDAMRLAHDRGADFIDVTANPHAMGFYRRVGFEVTGEVQTRFAPAKRMRLDCRVRGLSRR